MKQPKPTSQLIQELCAGTGRQSFIESVHHGLYETPLGDFYSALNIDEVVAFAAASWQLRDSRQTRQWMRGMVDDSSDAYGLFREVYAHPLQLSGVSMGGKRRNVFEWLSFQKNISPEEDSLYRRFNLFPSHTLEQRLQQTTPQAFSSLRSRLQHDTHEYLFEIQYHERKQFRRDDCGKEIMVMTFQNVYPKKGRIIPAYAQEIGRMLRKYPAGETPVVVPKLTAPEPEQLKLF